MGRRRSEEDKRAKFPKMTVMGELLLLKVMEK
jgi:hypothetical protein